MSLPQIDVSGAGWTSVMEGTVLQGNSVTAESVADGGSEVVGNARWWERIVERLEINPLHTESVRRALSAWSIANKRPLAVACALYVANTLCELHGHPDLTPQQAADHVQRLDGIGHDEMLSLAALLTLGTPARVPLVRILAIGDAYARLRLGQLPVRNSPRWNLASRRPSLSAESFSSSASFGEDPESLAEALLGDLWTCVAASQRASAADVVEAQGYPLVVARIAEEALGRYRPSRHAFVARVMAATGPRPVPSGRSCTGSAKHSTCCVS